MKEKRRLEVFWETREITTISLKRNLSKTFFCQPCRSDALHLTVSEAALILKFSEIAIFRFVETDQLHSIETVAGIILICGNSLAALDEIGSF